jgi:hypothetical protein
LDAALKSASLDWPIRAFLWSGANSVHARDCAAKELSDHLTKDLQDPDTTAVIIAHSHGGNVALRALQHLGSADRVRVVTLATPFLRVFAQSFELSMWVNLFMGLALCIILFAGVLAIDSGLHILNAARKITNDNEVVPTIIMALAGVVSFLIVRWLNKVFINPRAALAIEQVAHYDTKGAAASRMLVIRGVDDEASLSLAAGSIGSRLSFLTLVGVIPAMYAAAIVLIMLSSLFAVDDPPLWMGGLIIGSFFGALIFFFVPVHLNPSSGESFWSTR